MIQSSPKRDLDKVNQVYITHGTHKVRNTVHDYCRHCYLFSPCCYESEGLEYT